jgi:Fe-S-cluster containining protein
MSQPNEAPDGGVVHMSFVKMKWEKSGDMPALTICRVVKPSEEVSAVCEELREEGLKHERYYRELLDKERSGVKERVELARDKFLKRKQQENQP